MWHEDRPWLHYVKNIIAADVSSAVFLASYLRGAMSNKHFVGSLEVIDLQRYKVIRQPDKVRVAIKERMKLPFIFVVGKN